MPIRNENTGGATGWCLDVHDLAVSKLAAGRDKDLAFVRVLVQHGMADVDVIQERLGMLALPHERIEEMRTRIQHLVHDATN